MRKRSIATAVAATIIGARSSSVPPGRRRRRSTTRSPPTRWRGWSTSRSPTAGFELADFPGFETPDAVLAIAEQAQVEPAWSTPLARAAVDAVVSTDGFTPLDHLDDLVEGPGRGHRRRHPGRRGVPGRGAGEDPRPRRSSRSRGRPASRSSDFDPSDDSADPVDIRPTVLASAGDGTFSAMTFNGRLYVLLVGGTQAGGPASIHVKAAQQPNGAWNFAGTPSGHAVDADTTGLALQALSVRDVPSSDPAVRDGLAALAREPAARRELAVVRRGRIPNSTAARRAGHPRRPAATRDTPCWREALDDGLGRRAVRRPGRLAARRAGRRTATSRRRPTSSASPPSPPASRCRRSSGSTRCSTCVRPHLLCADVADDERFVHSAVRRPARPPGRRLAAPRYQAGRLRAGALGGERRSGR